MSRSNDRPVAFCAYCGTHYAKAIWPRHCEACGQYAYRNPIPVSVVLLPVGHGLLVVRRGEEPARGELSLPGGFIDLEESWQEAAARELFEETQMAIDPAVLRVYSVHSAPDGTLLIFSLAPPWDGELPPFTASYETLSRDVITGPQPLAFPLHSLVVASYFAHWLHAAP